MSNSPSERRMAENEVMFRQYNESVQKGFDRIQSIAKETNQEHMLEITDIPLHFYCECSDENCRERVKLKPSRYNQIHKKRDRFVIICGHETKSVERVIAKETEFCIIEKFTVPPESVARLNKTRIDNT